jgi:hypothetical protein
MIRNVGGRVELSYSDATAASIAQASGGHPFLARQLCSLAYKQRNQQPGEVPLQSVQAAAERFLFDPQYSTPTLGDNGLWSEISNVKLWGEQAARVNQSVLLTLAQSAQPLREIEIANDPEAALKRSALLALQQLSVIRPVEEISDQSDSRYMIAFGLFRSWIRRVRLGLKE